MNIVDQYNRKCLGIDARTSMPSRAVIHFLERMIEKHGKPKGIRTDNGGVYLEAFSRIGWIKTTLNGLKSKKESHSRMPLSSVSTKPTEKMCWTPTCFSPFRM
ncbi:hypothetical protein LDL59_13040 [Kaistella anthropi]|nr:hypothetical protein [Kaistella anthropi]